jgi:hypothetical protein
MKKENLLLIEAVQRFGEENWGLTSAALNQLAKSWRNQEPTLEQKSQFTESEMITENV